ERARSAGVDHADGPVADVEAPRRGRECRHAGIASLTGSTHEDDRFHARPDEHRLDLGVRLEKTRPLGSEQDPRIPGWAIRLISDDDGIALRKESIEARERRGACRALPGISTRTNDSGEEERRPWRKLRGHLTSGRPERIDDQR